ncbi:MAG TPA: hypothetical protein VGN75_03910 [Kaistia sp.]|jgi:hypothetical protein|nr:hypothetical protein [Kaistia sp.]
MTPNQIQTLNDGRILVGQTRALLAATRTRYDRARLRRLLAAASFTSDPADPALTSRLQTAAQEEAKAIRAFLAASYAHQLAVTALEAFKADLRAQGRREAIRSL